MKKFINVLIRSKTICTNAPKMHLSDILYTPRGKIIIIRVMIQRQPFWTYVVLGVNNDDDDDIYDDKDNYEDGDNDSKKRIKSHWIKKLKRQFLD